MNNDAGAAQRATTTDRKADLSFVGVTKFYGPVIGVNHISCEFRPGITGLLGANGAGKTTLIKLAAGLLRPSSGRVTLAGRAATSSAAKSCLGYSPDLSRLYEEMSGWEFVETMARLNGYPRAEARDRARGALDAVGMLDRAHRRIGGYSHGMRQRTKLAQALVHDPQVLLMDEPLAGIDPGGRRELSELMLRLAEGGKTILVSSHILVEVEHLADSVVMMARGRIIASGTVTEIRELIQDQPFAVEIEAEPARKLAEMLIGQEDVDSVELRGTTLKVRTRRPAQFFGAVGEIVPRGLIEVRRMRVVDAGADAIFSYLQPGAE